MLAHIRSRTHRWIRRRQGPDRGPVRLRRGRIYILPTGLGLAFGIMLFAMLMGSLNYGNNLGLALTFLLTALALVAMHACHRNLDGIAIASAGTDPPFAGQPAGFALNLRNESIAARIDIEACRERREADATVSLPPDSDAKVQVQMPTARRGRVHLRRFEVATRFPFGLFRAWAVLHPDTECLVYPRPAADAPPPPRAATGEDGASGRGEDDFSGLKNYHPGDPPRRIAWKAHARGGELLVKEFAGADESTLVFDLESAPGADLEAKLSVMARWVVEAHANGQPFGVRLPGTEVDTGLGDAQRRLCLDALARYGLTEEPDVELD